MIKAIFFDFDGVIMDSMSLKLEAYCECLREFNFAREDMNRLVREHMGQSRHRIIVRIYEELTGQKITPEIFDRALAKFNEMDDANREKMQFLPGSLEFIQRVHADRFTAVVTGTPEDFILKATSHHDLDQYFDIVRGSPDTKRNIVTTLLKEHTLDPEASIFIGDGKTDQDAADHCGLRFVGFDNGDFSFDPTHAWKVVTNLNQLVID